ncbi:MAG: hypothetical protein IT363_10275 [Methanoregulaceae archaeon]|nr:hypothetical protein [Methanoregulaceae archaeon]
MMAPVNLLFLGGALFFGGLVISGFAFVPGTSIAVIGVVLMVVHAVQKRRDPYSLSALHELDEQEEVRRLREQMGKPGSEDVVCPHCMNVYPAELPVCPNCQRSA